MAPDKLRPYGDPRAVHQHVTVPGGRSYHYWLAHPPAGRPVTGTILLVHGFPDLAFGWRYQVPLLAEKLGLRVVVPDLLGYGQTDAPEEVAPYGHKSVCRDLVAVVDHVLGGGQVDDNDDNGDRRRFFVGGHDWGGAVAWRMVLWHPDRVRAVFSVCTPYFAPATGPFVDLPQRVQALPSFGYQLQFAGDVLWRAVQGETRIRQFLSILFGGRASAATGDQNSGSSSSNGDVAPVLFTTAHGIDLARLDQVGPTPLLSAEELDYYVTEYARSGMRGPTNWYRTQRVNYEDERALVDGGGGGSRGSRTIAVPSLMVVATNDAALPPSLSAGMDRYFVKLTKHTVPGGHWVLWQSPDAVNKVITDFLAPLLPGRGTQRASI
ncbi:epoxide hydrolase [Niveomyces insectorum RCEF 264]|uniref:Epoxide hydrolase n=1 Tax=Niveomyces insectorum RCEF 264 TaxID=1081102 RepID=A0A167ZWN9_9HYPO|nr:epoxide hydrolase [Niveomyces insectorum RCEF 264]